MPITGYKYTCTTCAEINVPTVDLNSDRTNIGFSTSYNEMEDFPCELERVCEIRMRVCENLRCNGCSNALSRCFEV